MRNKIKFLFFSLIILSGFSVAFFVNAQQPSGNDFSGYIVQFKEKSLIEKKTELQNELDQNTELLYQRQGAHEAMQPKWFDVPGQINKLAKWSAFNLQASKVNNLQQSLPEKIERQAKILESNLSFFQSQEKITASQVLGKYKIAFNGLALNIGNERAEQIKKFSSVKAVYPNYAVKAFLPESVPLINADDVWQFKDGAGRSITGQGIKIAVIDTGVDYTHPDLGACTTEQFLAGNCQKVSGGYDFVANDNNPIDEHGHGTHVAATVAGNGILRGIAPEATIIAYRVLDKSGSGYHSWIISAIEKAVDPNGDGDFSDHLDIISMSLGGYAEEYDALARAVDAAVEAGVTAVIAAGNSGPAGSLDCRHPEDSTGAYFSICSPGISKKAITVAASTKEDAIAGFSSRGPTVWSEQGLLKMLIKPDISAPGVNICAAQWNGWLDERRCRDNEHIAINGTSMATPHVAGVAALIKQAHPSWSPAQIKSVLKSNAVKLSNYDLLTQGAGRIDALRAVITEASSSSIQIYTEINTNGEVGGVIDIKGKISIRCGEKGDVNQDGEITVADAQMIAAFRVGTANLSDSQRLNADVDGDGSISMIDALMISQFAAGLRIIFPVCPEAYEYKLEIREREQSWQQLVRRPVQGLTNDIIFTGLNTLNLREGSWQNLLLTVTDSQGNDLDSSIGILKINNVTAEIHYPISGLSISAKSGNAPISIIGSVGGTLFSHYDIAWANGFGRPTEGGDWEWSNQGITLSNNGNQPVSDNILAEFDASRIIGSRIKPSPISFRMRVYDQYNNVLEKFLFDGPILDKFLAQNWAKRLPIKSNSSIFNDPTVEDVDGDGRKDVIVVTGQQIYVYNFQGELLPGWPVTIENGIQYAPTVADLDQNGDMEIIVRESFAISNSNMKIYIFNHDGTNFGNSWPMLTGWGSKTPVIANIDRDAELEILFVDLHRRSEDRIFYGSLEAKNYDGSNVAGWPVISPTNGIFESLSIGNIDEDDDLEILATGTNGFNTFAFESNGNPIDGWPIASYQGQFNDSTLLVDLDIDGKDEIVVTELYLPLWLHRIKAFSGDGSLFPGWQNYRIDFSETVEVLTAGDVNNDGFPEIIVLTRSSGRSRLYVLSARGEIINGWPVNLDSETSNPFVGNADDDLENEIILLTAPFSNYNLISAYNFDGSAVRNDFFPYAFANPLEEGTSVFADSSNVSILDMNGDGKNELVFFSVLGSTLLVWEIQSPSTDAQWPIPKADARHTNRYNNPQARSFSPCSPYGDVNQDGRITKEDPLLISQFRVDVTTLNDEQKRRADVEGNGSVTMTDALKISQYIAGVITTFPVCGSAPAPTPTTTPTLTPTPTPTPFVQIISTPTPTPTTIPTPTPAQTPTPIPTPTPAPPTPTPTPIPTPTPTPTPVVFCDNYGDVNEDGTINTTDALFIAQYINGSKTFTDEQKLRADVNQDGSITDADSTQIAEYRVGTRTTFTACSKTPPCGSYGDVNNNGYVNQRDADLIARSRVGTYTLSDEEKARADVDGNGSITMVDSMKIAQYITGTINTFPACGVGAAQNFNLADLFSAFLKAIRGLTSF